MTPGRPDSADAATATTRTVERALDLLEATATAGAGSSLTELATAVGLSASTASRLLGTLAHHHYVARAPDGRFFAGPRLRQLAVSAMREDTLYELAGPHLATLAETTEETANLAVALDDTQALYLRQHAGAQFVRVSVWTGRTIPRRGTAIGAALDDRISDSGYVIARSSVEPDVTSIAAPVRADAGTVIAALSILSPDYRTSPADERTFGRLVAAHASELSAALRLREIDAQHEPEVSA